MLSPLFQKWFSSKGWQVRSHQLTLIEKAFIKQQSTLLIAPTGAGKTLAGFLPTLCDLEQKIENGTISNQLHTIYISPLKALAQDVARNVEQPIHEMGLKIDIETRTGDTPASKKQRQKEKPPHILMTTPEQLSLMLAHPDWLEHFKHLRYLILDELHALVVSKRGDLLALDMARLCQYSPSLVHIGLSATVAAPDSLRGYLMPQINKMTGEIYEPFQKSELVTVASTLEANITVLKTEAAIPWSGHGAAHVIDDIYQIIKAHKTTLIFVNTRRQAEMFFQDLWVINEDNLAIALHHGSLDVTQRRKVEAAMVAGQLKAIVCTSTLDLGIDWGDVDLVINLGAPKGVSRILQRIGRSNHRMNEASKAILVPSNRFEVMECQVAMEAALRGEQDSAEPRTGGLDVLAQHILGVAVSDPFLKQDLYLQICSSWPYRHLSLEDFEQVIDFVATGGYALRAYEEFAKIKVDEDGYHRISNKKIAQNYRMNVGTIVSALMIKIKLVKQSNQRHQPQGAAPFKNRARGGRILGEVEESFIAQLSPGDTFVFAGEVLQFEATYETEAYVIKAPFKDPKIPSYMGGKFPLSTHLADALRMMFSDERRQQILPDQVKEWLVLQKQKSQLPNLDKLLIETFPHKDRFYLVCYPFEGILVHQTLGVLLTRRLERAGAKPLGFVAGEYALSIWGLGDMGKLLENGSLNLADLFAEDMLGDDLDAWLQESSLMKYTFWQCATIAGLIERNQIGEHKTARQTMISSDLIYNVLRTHDPDHILLQATYQEAATGLLDIARLGHMLKRIQGKFNHIALDHVSPLAVPVMLEIGKELVFGEGRESLIYEAAQELIDEAMKE